MKKIDNEFFINYASTGLHYNKVWRSYTGFNIFQEYLRYYLNDLETCLVLGSATGQILKAITDECGLYTEGVEKNQWASEQTPSGYMAYTQDMKDFVKEPRKYQIIYSNSLMYLNEDEVVPFLKDCNKLCTYFFWYGSMEGFSIADEYRTLLKPYTWWNEKFQEAGFKEMHRYLWKKQN